MTKTFFTLLIFFSTAAWAGRADLIWAEKRCLNSILNSVATVQYLEEDCLLGIMFCQKHGSIRFAEITDKNAIIDGCSQYGFDEARIQHLTEVLKPIEGDRQTISCQDYDWDCDSEIVIKASDSFKARMIKTLHKYLNNEVLRECDTEFCHEVRKRKSKRYL